MSTKEKGFCCCFQAIVDNFRVSELVTVCTVAGVSRNGKKTELLSRIYNLIRDPVPTHVEKKIMELYKIWSVL